MLGICYYPEHWPESMWAEDAKEMKELGLNYVRIAEFAWSKMEPIEGEYHFDWLDRAIETLAAAGLQVIMCTPTATPPKWLVDKYPSVLPIDINTGNVRGFGSRRHYDFSSPEYLAKALDISEVIAKRYGCHPNVCGWQTDNELACHDTTHSGSQNAKQGFQRWCKERYSNIDNLNKAWGNIFWSMEYQTFEEIELPILAVTETNPSHQLAYRRYSSDKVVQFHDEMIDVIKKYSPNKFITHNFIPMHDTQTDNYALAKNLDFVSYDNYPLGRSDLFFSEMSSEEFKPYMRTGHPDFASYAFDQSRGLSKSNFWVMEQQPGPVNWALHNPRPEKGMVRLWSWQAFAHGAECVCYFRWRQAPFAQEQMHAGIKRNDNSKSQAWYEVSQVRDDLAALNIDTSSTVQSKIAIVTGTLNQWVSEIEIQGINYNHQQVEFAYYSALRQLGLTVDFISVDCDISDYSIIVAPCLPIVNDGFITKCKNSNAHLVFGPRSGSKTDEFELAPTLGPGLIQSLIPIKVISTETIRSTCSEALYFDENVYSSNCWREELECGNGVNVIAQYHDDTPAVVQYKNVTYIASLTCHQFLLNFFEQLAEKCQIATIRLPKDVRLMKRGNLTFIMNYSGSEQQLPENIGKYIIGSKAIAPYDVAVLVE
jgi:beta-galactosidase